MRSSIAPTLLCGLCLMLPLGARADAPAPLTPVQIADGLSKLGSVIAKDVPPNARWIRLEHQKRAAGVLNLNGDPADIKGNGFLISESPGKQARIWLPAMARATTVTHAKAKAPDDSDVEQGPGSVLGEWSDADLSHDVEAVADLISKYGKAVAKDSASKDDENSDPFGPGDYGNRSNPRAILNAARKSALAWAAALQKSGRAAEALTIGQAAFHQTSDTERKRLLDELFNGIATAQWQEKLQAFSTHHDWARLRDDLDHLIRTLPNGWGQRDAARVLLRTLVERAKQPAEPPLKLGQQLPEADQKILVDWLAAAKSASNGYASSWSLIPVLEADEDEPPPAQADAPGKSFPASKGVAALPMLAALLSDDTLMVSSLSENNSYYHDRGGHDPVERLKQNYPQFPKPSSRADYAWLLLQQVLPGQMRYDSEGTMAERAEQVLQWYASIKNASPADIAMSYIESGDASPNYIAHIASLTDEKKLARVEDALVGNAEIYSLERIEPFVKQRGTKAAGFIKKLRTKLEADIERYQSRDDSQRKQLERVMKRLEALASGEVKQRSADELFALVAKVSADTNRRETSDDEAEAADAWKDLPGLLAKMPDLERLSVVMKHLPTFQSSQSVTQIYWLLFIDGRNRGDAAPINLKLKPEQRAQAIAQTKEQWRVLLEGKLPDLKDDNTRDQFVWTTAAAIESVVTGKSMDQLMRGAQGLVVLGPRLYPLLRERAMSCLEGKEPPPMPDAKSVPDDEIKRTLTDFGNLSPDELRPRLDALTPSAFLALHAKLLTEEKWPTAFTKLASQITQTKLTGVKDEAAWQSWKGKAVTFENIVALAKQASIPDGTDTTQVTLTTASALAGWMLSVHRHEGLGSLWFSQQLTGLAQSFEGDEPVAFASQCKTMSVGYFASGRERSAPWVWFDAPTIPPTKDDKTPTPESKLPISYRQFIANEAPAWEKLRSYFAEQTKPDTDPIGIYFFTASSAVVDQANKRETDGF